MNTSLPLLQAACHQSGRRLPLPEYRQIELYSKKKKLHFDQPPAAGATASTPAGLPAARLAFQLLQEHFATQDPLLLEGLTSWQRYLALPRDTTLGKVAAELYRILRIVHIASLHREGHCSLREGLVRLSCNFDYCALDLNITPAGLDLLVAAVQVYLDAGQQPYSQTYTEALLLQYFSDLVIEIRKFADEDRVLYQFRPPFSFFNRHSRFDCDNPKVTYAEDRLSIEVGRLHQDPVRYPIDFYLELDDALYILPVEALKDFSITRQALAAWRAATAGKVLPAHFAQRFGREDMIVGLPMT